MEHLEGMPGTISAEAKGIRWHKTVEVPAGRAYEAMVADGRLKAIVSRDTYREGPLWHISVSHCDMNDVPDRVPTWDELKHAYYHLVPADVPMVLIFPRKSTPKEQYVDIYPTCLHLWESPEADR